MPAADIIEPMTINAIGSFNRSRRFFRRVYLTFEAEAIERNPRVGYFVNALAAVIAEESKP
jgi:hypothetical protein